MAFMNADGTFDNEIDTLPVVTITPVSGATAALPHSARRVLVKLAATVASLTLQLPRVNATTGHFIEVCFTQAVTALTVNDASGAALASAPTAGVAGTSFKFVLIAGVWTRWR